MVVCTIAAEFFLNDQINFALPFIPSGIKMASWYHIPKGREGPYSTMVEIHKILLEKRETVFLDD